MKQNMGNADRIARSIIVVLIAALYLTGQITGTVALVLLAVAVILLVTSAFSFCPLYMVLGLSTKTKEEAK